MCIYNGGTLSEKVKANNMKILDTNMIFARAMALKCSQRNYDTKMMMAHELAHRPATTFDDRGTMTVAKTKLFLTMVLKTNLKVDLARRQAESGWVCSIVGLAIAFMRNTRHTSSQHLPSPQPAMWNAVISTRCSTDAWKAVPIIKPNMTEIKEPTDSIRVYSLSSTAKLPCKKVVLTVGNHNTQLIDLIRQT